MNEEGAAWFAGLDRDDLSGAAKAVTEGEAANPRQWPEEAVESGAVPDKSAYYGWLHEATVTATEESVRAAETADDQQLIHAVRAMDDCARQANELAERVSEWGGSFFGEDASGISYARDLAEREPESPTAGQIVSLAGRCVDLDGEAQSLRAEIERVGPSIAPNLSELAGPVLAGRLIALAGGLESLAKSPAGTIQVLGAEDALFAHLREGADPPKHGVIFTHEAIRGTDPDHRGSMARALAGKLAIAARIDHYSGRYNPELKADLQDRIETIQSRTGGDE